VEYEKWGDGPAWRCLADRRHHQKVVRSHLRLPKMRVLIPKAELRRLEKHFGPDGQHDPAVETERPRKGFLFDV